MKGLLFSLLILTLANAAQSQILQEGFHVPGTFPTAAAFGDVNSDGQIDFLQTYNAFTGQSPLNATKVWINNGDSTFTLFGEFGTAVNEDIKLADMDNDGDLDAVTSSRIFLNDGTGTFTIGQYLGNDVWAVEVADFNEDGFMDVFCAVYNLQAEDKLYLSQGSAQSLILTQMPWTTGSYSSEATVVDINQDNHMDIIILKGNSPLQARRENEIWTGNGDGTFFKSPQMLPQVATWKVDSGDYNGDGTIDLVVVEADNLVRGYLNNGTSLFQNFTTLYSAEPASDVDLVDIDVDGDLDLVIAKFAFGTETYSSVVLFNDGNGNFTEGSEEFSISDTFDIEAFDIDNDNDKDLFTINVNDADSVFWINQTDPVLAINENEFSNIALFPNPAKNFINLKFHNTTVSSVTLFSTLGNLQQHYSIDSDNFHLNIENLTPGVYYLKIALEDGKFRMTSFIKK
ncbi:MAG: hypothetical protein COA40_12295 [Aequorivita sp.]|nr:MAG: hypothetical protein COA40_12295 [Aequorivita sp.]